MIYIKKLGKKHIILGDKYWDKSDIIEYNRFHEKNEFIHYYGHLTPKILLQEISKYDFGWVGFNATKNREHLDVTLPNKLFEYISCGLLVLSFPHRTQKRII